MKMTEELIKQYHNKYRYYYDLYEKAESKYKRFRYEDDSFSMSDTIEHILSNNENFKIKGTLKALIYIAAYILKNEISTDLQVILACTYDKQHDYIRKVNLKDKIYNMYGLEYKIEIDNALPDNMILIYDPDTNETYYYILNWIHNLKL